MLLSTGTFHPDWIGQCLLKAPCVFQHCLHGVWVLENLESQEFYCGMLEKDHWSWKINYYGNLLKSRNHIFFKRFVHFRIPVNFSTGLRFGHMNISFSYIW